MIELCEQDRDLPLAEGVVQGIVDHLRGHAHAGGAVAVDHQESLQPLRLLVAGHIGQLWQLLEFRHQLRCPLLQFAKVGRLKGVLILRAAHPGFHREILHRLHEQPNPVDFCQPPAEPPDHLCGGDAAILQGHQIDLDPPAVARDVGAIDANKAGEALHGGIFQDRPVERLLTLAHGLKRDPLRRLGDAQDHAGILNREEALGHLAVEMHCGDKRGKRHEHREPLMAQHDLKRGRIGPRGAVEESLTGAI